VVEGIVEGFDEDMVRGSQERLERGVQMQHRDDRRRGGQAKLNVKLRANEQEKTPMSRGWDRSSARVPSLAWRRRTGGGLPMAGRLEAGNIGPRVERIG